MGAQTDTATLDERDLVTHQYHLRVVEALVAERDRYRDALEAARDALADPNAMAEDIDSPANMAFAIINHAIACDTSRRGRRAADLRKGRS